MKPNQKRTLWIVLGAAALTALLLLSVVPKGRGSSWHPATEPSYRSAESSAPGSSTEPESDNHAAAGIQYPYDLDDGRLQITSLFQYSGMNPDAELAEGENIAAMVVTNSSEDYLEKLTVTAAVSDGSILHFEISDLPAGQTVWAFARENSAFDPMSVCTRIESQSSFTQVPGELGTTVSYQVQGVEVTLTNETDSVIPAGELRCHIVLNGIYFGGTSYAYPVGPIPSEGSATVTAADCILGEVAPVRLRSGD